MSEPTLTTERIGDVYSWATAWKSSTPNRPDLDRMRAAQRAEFEAWLKAHDAEVAATERARITSAISDDARRWQETADQLRLDHEYTDAIRYDNYATARLSVAAQYRNTEIEASHE